MDCTVTHTCQCSMKCGLGFPSLLRRLVRRNKRKLVDAATQTDDDLIDVLVAKKWGERIPNRQTSMRTAPPPPPPERKHGRQSTQPENSCSNIGPFAPTVAELLECKASLKPVNRKLTPSGSVPSVSPGTPPAKSQLPPKSASMPGNNSPLSPTPTGDGHEMH